MTLISRNPATGEVIQEHDELTPQQVEEKLTLAQQAFESWRATDLGTRAGYFHALAQLLREDALGLAAITTREMGRPITQSKKIMEKNAWVCEYYAHNAQRMLQAEAVATDATESYVQFEPLGCVLAVMPWNYPLWQVLRFAAPALMAGNVGLLKHASNVQLCAQGLEALLLEAGFPKGVFQNLAIDSSQVDALVRDDRVKAVTLTGSEKAGAAVASAAAREIKPAVLELGGSDPFIILADADIEKACATAATARLQNTGQSCIAAKRFIVVESIAQEAINRLKECFEAHVLGDPMDERTTVGPLVSEQARNDIEDQVRRTLAEGGTLITGGERVFDRGYFYRPTVIRVTPDMTIAREEVFGPVAALMVAKDEEDALRMANASRLGLGASLWTRDIAKAKQCASRIEAGAVFINGMVKSDPRLPFGGIKKSGFGRELSHYGLKEFVNIKTVWIA